jgi:glycosyltransferase A (GT-A) superfamily protein (DUF2064 family)
VPPALIVLVDAATSGDELGIALDTARQVGGVARVLLFHPADIETDLARRSLGFRLWPQEGATAGERFSNAFRQAVDLGYDGGLVLRPAAYDLDPSVITSAAAMLAEHMGVVLPDDSGGVALLALQQAEPALLAGEDVPAYDEVVSRARQLRVRLVELSPSTPSGSQPGR